jgi:hypothetical protein
MSSTLSDAAVAMAPFWSASALTEGSVCSVPLGGRRSDRATAFFAFFVLRKDAGAAALIKTVDFVAA